jgi:hypothetical protein
MWAWMAAGVGLIAAATIVSADDARLITPSQLEEKVAVRDVNVQSDGVVSGTVVNTSGMPVRDVKLMVDYRWLWKDEFHPGTNSPGYVEWTTLPGELAPGESRTFTVQPETPLSARTDGHFAPAVDVSEVTEMEQPGATAGRR